MPVEGKINPLEVKTSEKVAKLMTQTKLLWPKYDPDLGSFVNGKPLINKYVENCFTDAGLKSDYDFILQNKRVDDIIIKELNTKEDTRSYEAQKAKSRPVNLNQKQCQNVIKKMYDFK